MLTEQQGKKLIVLARKAIESVFTGKKMDLNEYKKEFPDKQGVFVTLKLNNELKGCIGFAEPTMPLYEAVVESAKAAAFEDPRFMPLEENELNNVKIEISVLTKPELIKVKTPEDYVKQIKVGKDGLIVKYGPFSGLLLPQVAIEYDWDAEEFLNRTCEKAGLSSDTWKNKKCNIYKFQAQIFKE